MIYRQCTGFSNKCDKLIKPSPNLTLFRSLSVFIYPFFSKYFHRHPFYTIVFFTALTGICCIPCIIDFKKENDQFELWLPKHGDYYVNAKWIQQNYPSSKLYSEIIIETSDTFLNNGSIRNLCEIYYGINELLDTHQVRVQPICTRWWSPTYEASQCIEERFIHLLASGGKRGMEKPEEIVHKVKNTLESICTLNDKHPRDVKELINGFAEKVGDPKMEPIDFIIDFNRPIDFNKVRALHLVLEAEYKEKEKYMEKENCSGFCQTFIRFMENYTIPDQTMKIHYATQSEVTKSIIDSTHDDMVLLFGGCTMVLIYVFLVIGKFNSVEQRCFLSLMGMLSIVFGVAISLGLGQLSGLKFGLIHYLIPFLLLGIGIDDMFVIVQGLNNVQKEKNHSR